MTRITKYIPLTMASTSNVALANIQIPFDVKRIITKTAVIHQLGTPTLNSFVCLISDLIEWSPHKIIWDDESVFFNTSGDIVFEFQNPRSINGTYTFRLKDNGNNDYTAQSNIFISLLLEFQSADDD